MVVTTLLVVAMLVAGGWMLYSLGSLASKQGESVWAWCIGLSLVWGFIWFIYRTILLVLGPVGAPLHARWSPWLIAGAVLSALVVYALYWLLLHSQKGRHPLEDQVDEIGQ